MKIILTKRRSPVKPKYKNFRRLPVVQKQVKIAINDLMLRTARSVRTGKRLKGKG